MGVYLHYQAMTDGGRLLRRLREEPALCAAYAETIDRPAGPFDIARLDPEELDGYLSDIAGNPVFGSVEAARRSLVDLQAELARAAEEYPGLRARSAYLKLREFEYVLARAAAGAGRPGLGPLAKTLVWGGELLGLEGWCGTAEHPPRLVPPGLVAEAAALLGAPPPGSLGDWEDDRAALWGVYGPAAALGEAVVVA